jgi:hypothetical protein
MSRRAIVGAAAGVVTLGLVAGWIRVQPEQPDTRPPAAPDLGRMLIEGLRKTEGCLGVDAAQMMSGRNTIIAWFENKAAVRRWYDSDVHQGAMRGFAAPSDDASAYDPADRPEPLAHIESEDTPIMVMATITMARESAFEGVAMPISQISIELYAPLPGGAFLGRRLAPDTFKVPMRDYTPEDAG